MTRNQTPDQMVEEVARLLDAEAADEHASSSDLGELVHLAEGLRDLPTAVPTEGFRERLRGQLLTESASMLPATATAAEPATIGWRERLSHWRRSVSLAIASALSATTIGGAGVAVASQSALPGDTLYDVKRGIESVRMAVASGDLEAGRLHLAFARERLEEVTEGVDELSPDGLIDTLDEMDESSALGANELLDAYDRTGDTEILRELGDFVADQRAGLFAIVDELPVEVVPFAEQSLELVRRIEVQATDLFLDGEGEFGAVPRPGEAPARDADADAGTTGTTGDGGTHPDGTQEGTTDPDGDTDTSSESDLLGELDDPLESPSLDTDLDTDLDPTLEPTLEPSLDPSLDPTDELSDTVDSTVEDGSDTLGDLLYE